MDPQGYKEKVTDEELINIIQSGIVTSGIVTGKQIGRAHV